MGPNLKSIKISSPDIENHGSIDKRFTQEGADDTPILMFEDVPSEAVELAVIMNDPDAPWTFGFTHWTLYGIPADTTELNPVVISNDCRPGPNSAGETGWIGPMPPNGHGTHHYFFQVYALNRKVEGEPSREDFLRDYGDAIIDQARFVGTYVRD